MPGIYILTSVKDAYCQGSIQVPSETLVQQTYPPTISIMAESIEQSCVGTVGALVNVSLTGDAPFWIDYDEIFRGVRTRRSVIVDKLRETLRFRPALAGRYVYEFQAVGDATYTEGIPIQNTSITQIIHPQSEARFAPNTPQRLTKCIGDTVSLPVSLHGSGPWVLSYEIAFENRKERFSVSVGAGDGGDPEEVTDGEGEAAVEIVTPVFDAPGVYVVDLIEITDSNGCSWLLETQDRPSVGFTRKSVLMLDGDSAALGLALAGRQPFNIQYINKAYPEHIFDLRGMSEKDMIHVHAPGSYEIVGMSDSVCAGTAKQTICEVKIIPRPTIAISTKEYESEKVGSDGFFERREVCQDVPDSFEVIATGKAPFAFKYTVDRVSTDANGKHGEKKRLAAKNEVAAGNVNKVLLSTSDPGIYYYSFNEIVDDNYKKPPARTSGSAPFLTGLKQTVLGRPNAHFMDARERVFQCLGDDEEESGSLDSADANESSHKNGSMGASGASISIQLAGTPPFDLTLELKHENHPAETIHVRNISTKVHRFRPPTLSATGRYSIRLLGVTDATGCARVFEQQQQQQQDSSAANSATQSVVEVSVAVSDVARIASMNAAGGVCVGDVLTYTLQGTPPFTIAYEFERSGGKGTDGDVERDVVKGRVTVVDPLLTLYAAEAGIARITRVCNSVGCCTRPVPAGGRMETVVHELPSAIVDGGNHFVEDIREGDETVIGIDFLGEPPFSFTYARRDLKDGSADDNSKGRGRTGKAEESFTITGVESHHYEITTGQEGLFHVTAVYDKYCGYPRVHQAMGAANAVLSSKGTMK
ncbi:hypothetical protein HDU84_006688 [Entophlyctis sp. JEL0112]|nr:hypothetical protein HDU84_006688 [Entophlyctis sp. JEL0112]